MNAMRQYAAVKAINPRRRSTREARTAREPRNAMSRITAQSKTTLTRRVK
jgi:hypothetical protein